MKSVMFGLGLVTATVCTSSRTAVVTVIDQPQRDLQSRAIRPMMRPRPLARHLEIGQAFPRPWTRPDIHRDTAPRRGARLSRADPAGIGGARPSPGGPHEIVLVDDGSEDRTFELIREAAARDSRVVGVQLSRNFGHQAALTAALETVAGDVVVVMDGDLQDRPEEIPRFLAAHERGFDVVYAQRTERKEGVALRASYFLFYRLLNRLSELEVPVDSGDFALLSRRVVDQLNRLPERHRYLRGLRTWVGFRQTGISVERDRRAGGEPSYTVGKLLRLGFDGVFAFSVTPLRAAWILGAVASAAASIYALWAIFERLFLGTSPQGFTALIVAITFFAGIQLLFLD